MDLVRSEPVLSAQHLAAPVKGKDKVGLGSDPTGEAELNMYLYVKNTKKSLLCPFCYLLQCLILYGHLQGGK